MLKKFVQRLLLTEQTATEITSSNPQTVPAMFPFSTEETQRIQEHTLEIPQYALIPPMSPFKPYHDQLRQHLQTQLNQPPQRQILKLIPQEYPGPLFLNKSMIIDGQGATLWAFKGPVLHINAPTLALKNLHIEVTGEQFETLEEECAIHIENSTALHFENVQIRGTVLGLTGEIGQWQYPHSLQLGKLPTHRPYHFQFTLQVPTSCRLESNIEGLQLKPMALVAGSHVIHLNIAPLKQEVTLDGDLFLKTYHLTRRIHLTAHFRQCPDSQPLQSSHLELKSVPQASFPTQQLPGRPIPVHSQITPAANNYHQQMAQSVFFKQVPTSQRNSNFPSSTPTEYTGNIFLKHSKQQ